MGKPKLIQMLGMDMDTDTDHTGDMDTDLLTIIHTHTDTMDTMVDTVDTTTENRLLQYKYRMWLPQKQDKNHQQIVKISKHISILNIDIDAHVLQIERMKTFTEPY